MTITQTVKIPANRRMYIDFEVPREVTAEQATVIIQFPAAKKTGTPVVGEFEEDDSDEFMAAGREILSKHINAFKALAK